MICKSRNIFDIHVVDSFNTILDHIGKIQTTLANGTIGWADLISRFYDLAWFAQGDQADISLFKNAGGCSWI